MANPMELTLVYECPLFFKSDIYSGNEMFV